MVHFLFVTYDMFRYVFYSPPPPLLFLSYVYNLPMVCRLVLCVVGQVDYVFLGQLATRMLESSLFQYPMLSK
jgi:hypothetical protein